MSVMTPDDFRPGQGPRTGMNGRPLPTLPAQPDVQRQAVIDQLAPAQATPAAQPMGASASSPASGRFNRGGEVRQLPGMGAEMTNRAVGAGATAATAAMGAVNPVSIGTNYLGNKLKPKEEMPTFGGEFGHLTDSFGRRFEGAGPGIKGGAVRGAGYGAMAGPIGAGVGAAAGAIIGAATKNATSAYSDFRAEDAAQAIGQAYQEFLGRPASDDEIATHMANVGWDEQGGDRWMGEKPLTYILVQIKGSPEAQQRATRGAVVDQLGAAGPAPDALKSGQVATGGPGPAGAVDPGRAGIDDPGRAGLPAEATRVEGSAPAGAAPADPSGWNTDGFAAPTSIAQNFRSQAPAGWDQTKWNDPTHQTPKYVWGRIAADDNPNDIDQLLSAYPGATFNGKDKVTIPGVGPVDVYRGASVGLNEPQWLVEGGGEGAAGGGGTPTGDPGARGVAIPEMDDDTLARIKAELERITAGQPPRDALLAQLGG
jgi:hypothetical protein